MKKGVSGTWQNIPVTWYWNDMGFYEARVQPPIPTIQTRQDHAATIDARRSLLEGISALCLLCQQDFRALPSQLAEIEKKGVCSGCLLYCEGKFGGIVIRRDPTVDEILDRAFSRPALNPLIAQAVGAAGLTSNEQRILLEAVRSMRKSG
jgi:hypothetical protein